MYYASTTYIVESIETGDKSEFQRVSSTEPQPNYVSSTSTAVGLAQDSVDASEMTSPASISEHSEHDKTSVHWSDFKQFTAGSSNTESSDSKEISATLTSDTFGTSSIESLSEGKEAVTSDTRSETISTDSTTATDSSEATTKLLGADWNTGITATIDELTTGTTDAFSVSEVENRLQNRSDSSFQNAYVSEDAFWIKNATTAQFLGPSTEERATTSESHVPSERLHTSVEDPASRTGYTTYTPRASPSTSETTIVQHTNDTGPVRRTQTVYQFSTVTDVSSEAPSASLSSPSGQFIGIVVGATVAVVFLVVIVILAVIYYRKRRKSCDITDEAKDYRSLMKRQHDPMALASPSVAQPTSPFSDMFPQDITNNGLPLAKYKMLDSDDGPDGIEIVRDSREQRSPKEIPIEEYELNSPSGYSNCSYSVNTFRPPEKNNEQKNTASNQSEAETKLNANESSGNDENGIEEQKLEP